MIEIIIVIGFFGLVIGLAIWGIRLMIKSNKVERELNEALLEYGYLKGLSYNYNLRNKKERTI